MDHSQSRATPIAQHYRRSFSFTMWKSSWAINCSTDIVTAIQVSLRWLSIVKVNSLRTGERGGWQRHKDSEYKHEQVVQRPGLVILHGKTRTKKKGYGLTDLGWVDMLRTDMDLQILDQWTCQIMSIRPSWKTPTATWKSAQIFSKCVYTLTFRTNCLSSFPTNTNSKFWFAH